MVEVTSGACSSCRVSRHQILLTALLFALVVILPGTHAQGEAPITGYTVLSSDCAAPRARWADFDDDQLPTGDWYDHRYAANFWGGNPPYTTPVRMVNSTDFTMPLFGVENVSLYVNSDGFVSVSPNSICRPSSGFCNSLAVGTYLFDSRRGGDWPMIALYAADFNARVSSANNVPAEIRSRDIYSNVTERDLLGVEVEYRRLPVEAPASINVDIDETERLWGRIRLFRNGTVLLKYRNVPANVYFALGTAGAVIRLPSAGIVYMPSPASDEGKIPVSYPTPRTPNDDDLSVCAYRLDPNRDVLCHGVSNCGECMSQGGQAALCAWCPQTSSCVNIRSAEQTCPVAQDLVRESALCNVSQLIRSTVEDQQRFYEVAYVRGDAASEATIEVEIAAVAEDFQTFPLTTMDDGRIAPVVLSLPFDVPVFDFPTEASQANLSSARLSNRVVLQANGPSIRFLMSHEPSALVLPACSWDDYIISLASVTTTAAPPAATGAASSTTTGSSTETCIPVGTAQYEVRPYTSPQLGIDPIRTQRYYTLPGGGPLCSAARRAGRATTGNASGAPQPPCPDAFVVELDGIVYVDRAFPSERLLHDAHRFDASIRVAIWADGAVSIHPRWLTTDADGAPVLVGSPSTAFPAPTTTLFGRVLGMTSPAVRPSPVVPGSTITFEPLKGCPDCGGFGTCDIDTMQCVCAAGRTGERCDRCADGFFGPTCERCVECLNGGTCDSGLTGTGTCRCTGQWSGQFCGVRCSSQSQCSPECNTRGGFCECGVCVCFDTDGWSGPTCSAWNDPCTQHSLDGCRRCVTAGSARCSYCLSSNLCILDAAQSAGVAAFGNVSFCAGPTMTFSTQGSCPTYRYDSESTTGSTVFDFVLLCVVLLLGCFAIIAFSFYRMHLRPIPPNLLLQRAVFSLPNRRRYGGGPFAGNRTIFALRHVINQPPKGSMVLALPLKQLELGALYEYQKATGDSSTTPEQMETARATLGLDHMEYTHDAETQALVSATQRDERRRRSRTHRRRERTGGEAAPSRDQNDRSNDPAVFRRSDTVTSGGSEPSGSPASLPSPTAAGFSRTRSDRQQPTAPPPARAERYAVHE